MDIQDQLIGANESCSTLRNLSYEKKSQLIAAIAHSVENSFDFILETNEKEVQKAHQLGLDDSQVDRLTLTRDRLKSMVNSALQVSQLRDPVGQIIESWTGENGIKIEKVRVPIGVVAVIYENRPNVTLDSACICLMSSNVCVLRGSSGARETNKSIVQAIHAALDKQRLSRALVTFIDDPSREGAETLMKSKEFVDVLIPRGGPSLISAIEKNATVPTIIDGAGNCHVYVDKDADLDMAEALVINSKTQRNSVCNAAESLVVHESIASEFIPRITKAFKLKQVEMVGDKKSVELGINEINPASDEDFGKEFLSNKISICVVDSIQSAIVWINKYSTGHTEMIVTDNPENADKFVKEITSAVVMHNTSTRFTDGERFGFGAEIGISTQKLHARGPMALNELTTYQYFVSSNGSQV